MLLLDLSHTSHTPARTGVQRVALELRRALRRVQPVQEITHDPHARTWRPLQTWEQAALDRPARPSKKRGASWPLSAQLRGAWQRQFGSKAPVQGLSNDVTGVVFPEVFTTKTAAQLPILFRAIDAPKVAIFHDAIALRLPELTPPGTVARFPAYLEELRQFDGIAAVSEDSRQSLLDYWAWAGWRPGPEVITLPLGCDHLIGSAPASAQTEHNSPLRVLCVGSLEGRKNHLTLINACEKLWGQGVAFELTIIGTLQRETGIAALDRIRALQTAGRPLIYQGWLSDEALNRAYQAADFTVYPSMMEGFGLPVWESLVHGKPCVCSQLGAVAETAKGGGCLMTDTSDPEALAEYLSSLLSDAALRARLTSAAQNRLPPTWRDYAQRLESWIHTLKIGPKTS